MWMLPPLQILRWRLPPGSNTLSPRRCNSLLAPHLGVHEPLYPQLNRVLFRASTCGLKNFGSYLRELGAFGQLMCLGF